MTKKVIVFYLPPQKLLAEVIVELLLIAVADGQIGIGIEDDAVFVDLNDAVEVDDITAERRRVENSFFFIIRLVIRYNQQQR